jgi:AhpD family alkylhydroperoxidase
MKNQLETNDERLRLVGVLKDQMPEVMAPELEKWDAVYKDGALSNKTKRLMALAIALRARCEMCIIGQTMRSLEAGATKQEIIETIGVNMAMSGTTGIAEGLRVIKLLEEMGKL